MSREHIVVAEQQQIEVYAGDSGYIVIKQSGGMEPVSLVYIDPMHAGKVADAILAASTNAEQFRQEWIAEGDNDTNS